MISYKNNQQILLKFSKFHDESIVVQDINCELALRLVHAQLTNGEAL